MKELPRPGALLWKVYKEYDIFPQKDDVAIVPNYEAGVAKAYNSIINDNSVSSAKRVKLFVEFANVKQNQSSILKIFKEHGALWTNENLLSDVYEEVRALKNAWDIYEALFNNKTSQLKDIIKLTNITDKETHQDLKQENTDTSDDLKYGNGEGLDNLKSGSKESHDDPDKDNKENHDKLNSGRKEADKEVDLLLIRSGLKKEPLVKIRLEKPYTRDDEFYNSHSFFYLIELIIFKIRVNKGALPSYIKITKDIENPLGYSVTSAFDCKSLAAALWIQFYSLIVNRHKLVKCKNETCSNFFNRDGKREYCSLSCKKAQNMRDWRTRKKDED